MAAYYGALDRSEGDAADFAVTFAASPANLQQSSSSSSHESPSRKSSKLVKTFDFKEGVALVLSSMLGSGIFASPGVVYSRAGSVGGALAIWVTSGMLTYAGAISYAELAAKYPSSGAEVTYLRNAYGSTTSFLFTWTNALVLRPASLAIMTLVCGEHLAKMSPTLSSSSFTLSCLTLIVVAVLNILPNSIVSSALNLLTSLKVVGLLLVVVGGAVYFFFFTGHSSPSTSINDAVDFRDAPNDTTISSSPPAAPQYPAAFLAALWAYDGWNDLAYANEEMLDPTQFAHILNLAIPLTMMLFTLVNVSYFAVLPLERIDKSTTLGVDLAETIVGARLGGYLMPVCVGLTSFGSAVSTLYAAARLTVSSAAEGSFPEGLGVIDETTGAPARAVAFQIVLALGFLLLGDFEMLVDAFGVAAWSFYFLTVLGLLLVRRRMKQEPPPSPHEFLSRGFTAPLVFPVVFCLASGSLVGLQVLAAPLASLSVLTFVLCGIPVRRAFVHNNNNNNQ